MDVFSVISLVGGLALFLYGMHVLSDALERMAGGKLEKILRKMTSNRFKGLLLGAAVTAVIQSSSAVTVMLVGLVNSGIMQLGQAISVTMGSNIGTTVTAWLLSLTGIQGDALWLQLLKPSHFSPLIAFVGVILIMTSKRPKRRDAGTVCVGFAVLMYGMTVMADAVKPLAQMESFQGILLAFSNPILGVLVGMIFTAVIQSSSASVGVLQTLAATGIVSWGSAIPIIMGQNIGTCVSAMLSAIGTNKNARRVAVFHLMFNCIGTVICLSGWTIADGIMHFAFTDRAISPFMIAITHSVFNIVTTILLFPFASLLEKLSRILIPDAKTDEPAVLLDERLMTVPAVAVGKVMEAGVQMAQVARQAVTDALELVAHYENGKAKQIAAQEALLDEYEDQLGTYLVKLSGYQMTDDDSGKVSMLLHCINDFERIGDHAINLMEVAQEMHDKKIAFSHEASAELDKLTGALREILSMTERAFEGQSTAIASGIEPLEQVIDAVSQEIRNRHILRLQHGNCTMELGFILTDLLTNCERVSDHCSNIAVALIETQHGTFDTHAYLNRIKENPTKDFERQYQAWLEKYALPEL